MKTGSPVQSEINIHLFSEVQGFMNRDKLLEIIRNLGSPRILVVGDFMLDIYTYGDAARISPEAPVPVLKVTPVIVNVLKSLFDTPA